jgi:hypothetical protein
MKMQELSPLERKLKLLEKEYKPEDSETHCLQVKGEPGLCSGGEKGREIKSRI